MSLDETYNRILRGIARERQEYARRLFQCLAESIRPLRAEELAEILAIQFDTETPPNYVVNWRLENPEEAVLTACSSLITIVDMDTSRVVQFSHFSVKEYLSSERLANAEKHLSQYHVLPHSAHTTLAQASLSVLLALDDQVDKERMKNFSLAIYAARYWVDHAQFDDVCSSIKVAMEQPFDPAKPHFSAWVWIYDIDHRFREIMFEARPTPPEAVPLYYATLCGFRDLVEHLIATHPQDVNDRGGHHTTPLHAAIAKGNLDVMMLLLEHGADVAAVKWAEHTPLYEASKRRRLDMMSLLLDHHADVNSLSKGGRSALCDASFEGDLEVARVLLQRGADADIGDNGDWTPLIAASRNGHPDVIRLLLQNGASVDSRNNPGRTALELASGDGNLDVVCLLLQNGANVDSRSDGGWTPLAFASANGHLDIVRLLLQSGAAVDFSPNDGWPPSCGASPFPSRCCPADPSLPHRSKSRGRRILYSSSSGIR
jgi:ankyrin repeat protein